MTNIQADYDWSSNSLNQLSKIQIENEVGNVFIYAIDTGMTA